MDNVTIQFFLKFGKPEHLQRLIKEGMVYINPVKEFKKEDQSNRYDLFEGLQELHHMNENSIFEIRVKKDEPWKRLNITKGRFQTFLNDTMVHSYSLFAITEKETRENELFPIPEEMKRNYGNYFVVINKPKLFIEKLEVELSKNELEFEYSLVKYYNPEENQKNLGYFHKSNKHSYEKEFRLLIYNKSKTPTTLFLGNLGDIATIHNASEFKGFRFIWHESNESPE